MKQQDYTSYIASGVSVVPSVPTTNQEVRITYNGLLFQNGATEVYAHVGFGGNWRQTTDYKMHRTPQGFELSIPVVDNTDSLNICFKDSSNNWDNNSGENYLFPVRKHNINYSLDYESEVSKI